MTNLTCAYGEPWIGAKPYGNNHCAGCARATLQGIQEFWQAVERGEMDAQGYTPNERHAQQLKMKQQHYFDV